MPDPPTMTVTLNGHPCQLPAGITVEQLLRDRQVPEFGAAVERNRAVVRKKDHPTTSLADGDVIEIVQFVGGG